MGSQTNGEIEIISSKKEKMGLFHKGKIFISFYSNGKRCHINLSFTLTMIEDLDEEIQLRVPGVSYSQPMKLYIGYNQVYFPVDILDHT